MTKTNRIDWMDTAKGIGIFLVVWGHFYASDTLKIVIYGFHMPLFFFLSGYLYKERAMSFLAFVKKKSKQLLLPFLMFQAVTFLIVNGLTFVASKQLDASPIKLVSEFFFLNGDLGFNSPLWFLVVLFSVEILFFPIYALYSKGTRPCCVGIPSASCLIKYAKRGQIYIWSAYCSAELVILLCRLSMPRVVFFNMAFIKQMV